jgi:hypothetical protein
MKVPQFPNKKLDFITFDGGLDVETPPLLLGSGFLRQAQNYEGGINGGYKTLTGYERFDGRLKPSDAVYAILNANITGTYAVGNTLTGATSGATGVIAAATTTYFVLTKVTGTFVNAENLQIAAVTIATAIGAQAVDAAATPILHAQYRNAAADIYRASIAAVPGEGDVLGVVQFNNIVYAFRNNVGSTAAVLYKSSSSGWTAVALGEEISFSNANTSVGEGDTLTQGGVTATIQRVVVQTGTLASGVNTGRLIITGRGGGNYAGGAATSTGGGALTLSAIQTAITLTPGGRYEFDVANFTGSTTTRRIYGCSGVQRGFEFDGTVYVPITTGMSPDTPNFVKEHKKHLFFAFGGSLQNSSIGFPYQWTPISGAAEFAQGDTITGLMVQPGSEDVGAMAVFSRNKTSVLYGSSTSDFKLVTYSEEQGAIAYSVQRVGGNTLMSDDRGVSTLATTANYGNFITGTLTQRIQRLIASLRTKTKASCVARDKNQYRLFFTDKSALYLTFNGNKLRSITSQLLTHAVTCIDSREQTDGSEAIYFGSSDGFVYQMEKGTSFDGQDIEAFIFLAFDSSKTARQIKHYQHGAFEVAGSGYAEFSVRYELGYNKSTIPQPDNQSILLDFAAPSWDGFAWDSSAVWDGSTLAPQNFDMPGDAENASLIVYSKSDYFSPLSFSGAFLIYVPRRGLR